MILLSSIAVIAQLTLIWAGFLGARFDLGGGEVKLPPTPI